MAIDDDGNSYDDYDHNDVNGDDDVYGDDDNDDVVH